MQKNISESLNRLAKKIQQSELIIFDYDGVFYKMTPEVNLDFSRAAVEYVAHKMPDISITDATQIAQDSYKEHGSSIHVFVEEMGIPFREIYAGYHKLMSTANIEPSPIITNLAGEIVKPKAILSHGSRHWVNRSLEHLDLKKHFDDKVIFSIEDVDYKWKHESPHAFVHVANQMGANPARTIMIEDTLPNLKNAKQAGMTTVGVTRGKEVDPTLSPYVDFVVKNTTDFLRMVYLVENNLVFNKLPQGKKLPDGNTARERIIIKTTMINKKRWQNVI